MNESRGELEINLRDVFGVFLKRWWMILLATILGGALLFGYAYATYTPMYKSTAKMYVNNNDATGSTTTGLSQTDILAAQSLVNTYCVIIESNGTMEAVIEKAELKNMTTSKLLSMVSCGSVNETEIFYISVVSPDRDEAQKITHAIVEILPGRIASVIEGASTTLVDEAGRGKELSPGYTSKAAIGALIGFVLSFALLFLYDVVINDTLQTETWLADTYKNDIPLLAVIPDVNYSGGKRYGRYKYYRRSNYYYDSKSTPADAPKDAE